jgi:20S proteasome subunit alpha 6
MVSKIGSLKERRRFANGHLTSLNNMVQILLRSVRGTSEPLSRSTIAHSHGPLRNAISPKDYYYTKQSYTSLAVMAIVNLVKDYAYEMKETRSVLEERLGNVIKGMPNAVIFEATDSLFLDWTTQEPRAGVGAGGNGRA